MKKEEKLSEDGLNYLKFVFFGFIWQLSSYFVFSGFTLTSRAFYTSFYYFGLQLIFTFIIAYFNPGLVNSRGKYRDTKREGTQDGDLLLVIIWSYLLSMGAPFLLCLDQFLFQISTGIFDFEYFGYFILIGSNLIFYASMMNNNFFESTVRIQKDREHKVIEYGIYSIVRHPGYLGMLGWSIGPLFAIGNDLLLIPCLLAATLVFFRTYREDKFLQENLNGYKAYTQKTKYRLFPLFW